MLTLLAALALPAPAAVVIPEAPEPALLLVAPLSGPSYGPALAPSDDNPEMEYTYIELNYLWTDSDAADESLDGVELIGSLELPLNFFGQLSAVHQEADAEIDTYRIGAGYHLPLGSRIDAYGILSYVTTELDGSGSDFDEDGIAGELGLRFLLTPKIELNGAAKWADVDDSDYGVAVGGRFYLIDMLSLGGRVESFGDDVSFAAGARLEF